MENSNKVKEEGDHKSKKRGTRISQGEVPANPLSNALRIPKAIIENYAGDGVTPLQLAMALDMTPTSGTFKTLTGSSIAYGLTDGGYNAKEITVTDLGRRIIKPLIESDDAAAKTEALLKPRVINEFLNKYNGKQIPRDDIALNILEDMGVPQDRTQYVFDLIIESAESLNLISELKNKKFVDLSGVSRAGDAEEQDSIIPSPPTDPEKTDPEQEISEQYPVQDVTISASRGPINKKVFITHGKNKALIDIIEEFLKLGELEAVVSVKTESVSKPVPEKFMEDMRACGAAIIHVDAEQKLKDENGVEQVVLNPNVLIEIGAAMALYGKRFILLVQEGVDLPSNLQGLYEVRYQGDDLGSAETIKLLNAINAMKNEPSPRAYP